MSLFAAVPLAPPDTIFNVTTRYNADTNPNKVNLGVGAYRTEEGKPWVLPVVRRVEAAMAADLTLNHEYLPIAGLEQFIECASRLVLGHDSPALVSGTATAVQTLSGTGAVRMIAEFLHAFHPVKVVYFSSPTWGNHYHIFKTAGYDGDCQRSYRYYCKETRALDFAGMTEDLENAPEGAIIVLHSCAHNPTGVDPNQEQWKKIADILQRRRLVPVFDTAYQGFATGDLEADAFAMRHCVSRGIQLFVAQSFSKNFGLYNERAGILVAVTGSPDEAAAVKSQLKRITRALVSNPPNHGARIVATVLNNPALYQEWVDCLKFMSGRIKEMRLALHAKLKANGTPGSWNHVVDQIGMFTFTGLEPKQVEYLTDEYHLYLLSNGRINMCGLTPANVDYVAKAIHETVLAVPF